MSDVRLDGNRVILEGLVSIGTNSPLRLLHAEGSEIHSGGSGAGFSFADRNQPGFVEVPSNGQRWVWYSANGIARLWSGADKVVISNSGNVGIGTTNPGKRLHVVGSGPVLIENPNGEADILFQSGSSQAWQVGTNATGWYVYDNSYRFVVAPGGNVGIGTKTPANKLHVVGAGPVTIENPNGEADILFKSASNQGWQVGTNALGWYVWDNAYRLMVKPGGHIGIGTTEPLRALHVEGKEIHSGGSFAGFSFSNRSNPAFVENPSAGERWLWYAVNGQARLWSGKDALEIQPRGDAFLLKVHGSLETAVRELKGSVPEGFASEPPVIRCRANALSVEDPAAPLALPGAPPSASSNAQVAREAPPPIPEPATPVPPRIALFHEFTNGQKDGLVINHQGRYLDGVRIEGNVHVTGALTHASSIALKENLAELSGEEAMIALHGLRAVKFNYKSDGKKQRHVGFIAEDLPELLATCGRDRLSPMDIIAVLTKAVQELSAEVTSLREQLPKAH